MKHLSTLLCLVLLSSFSVSAVNDKLDTKKKLEQTNIEQNISKQININKADQETLAALKGVGVKRAKAIISYRELHGKFNSLDDVLKVKGLGKNFLINNKEIITF